MSIKAGCAEERQNATHAMYLLLHAGQATYPAKTIRSVITELMYAEPFAWRAVGITRAALNMYQHAGRGRIQGIERAHLTDRSKMVNYVLDREVPLSRHALFSYWQETDRVVIALKAENRSNKLGDWLPFANPEAQYFPRLGIGFDFRRAVEGDLIRQLIEQISNEAAAD